VRPPSPTYRSCALFWRSPRLECERTRGRQSRTIRPSLVAIHTSAARRRPARSRRRCEDVAARRAIRAFQQSGIGAPSIAVTGRNRRASALLAANPAAAVSPRAVRAISAAESAASINVSVLRSSELAKPADSPTTTRTPTPSVTPYVRRGPGRLGAGSSPFYAARRRRRHIRRRAATHDPAIGKQRLVEHSNEGFLVLDQTVDGANDGGIGSREIRRSEMRMQTRPWCVVVA